MRWNLIIGETGSGKELVARTLYKQHLKRNYLSIEDAPFIAINCGAIPENLAESILFGHERGAFTSARERQYGRFEQAKRGILFLDEIQALAPSTQVKLLRAIQERKIDRLGSKSSSEINCRVIAATNIPLEILVEEGQFRTDLYYRLNICPIDLPPLRKRGADFSNITLGVQKYLNEKLNIPLREISRQCFEALEQYNWPGNIRELEHCLLYASIRTSNTIELTHLPPSLRKDCAHYLKDGNWDIVMQKKIHQQ